MKKMTEPEAEAIRSDATDLDTLRKMCKIREIEWHPRHKATSLRRLIDEYEERNAPPGDLKDQVEVANTGFASDKPQTPDWAAGGCPVPSAAPTAAELKPTMDEMDRTAVPRVAAAETFTPSNHELPPPVADALKWFGAYSIGRANIVKRYIDSLHAR